MDPSTQTVSIDVRTAGLIADFLLMHHTEFALFIDHKRSRQPDIEYFRSAARDSEPSVESWQQALDIRISLISLLKK